MPQQKPSRSPLILVGLIAGGVAIIGLIALVIAQPWKKTPSTSTASNSGQTGGNTTTGGDPPQSSTMTDDETYVAYLATQGVFGDRAGMIEVGHTVCDALDQGTSGTVLMTVAESSGFTADQSAAIIVGAVTVYCPWNQSALTS